jgi:hypothetical protein
MAIVDISPQEAQRPYLQGGEFGPGLTHEADVEVWQFEYPATERPCPYGKEKLWVAENPENNRHAYLGISVTLPNGERHFLDKWVRGSALKRTLLQCGVNVTAKQGGGFQFDDSAVNGMKLGGIVLSDPTERDGEMRTGFINSILSR